ncbi:hypothetical protein DSM106972_080590 [Dulcicalothrix desertica PCC 7102]|uniref:CHAT domain-containing protein n=1 Tax=Dulcicalothrix desertica PCC 7102 TaxID=232991 RepID=A0A433UXW1_9CYAN|nr:CHAT domain-containing protein [Dulcicalothrix desertica]RUS98673.1 hypothetical protein DSM106972_080590 [Dulcicalothrix desertica PCC 7102]TWH43177.1 CHAT domain-containing protein [Dulcicalothrix desertica PCC 7102]
MKGAQNILKTLISISAISILSLSSISSSSIAIQSNKSLYKQVAQQQNATLVEYSIITNNSQETALYIWVIKPTGKVIFRQVDLNAWRQKENSSLTDLITKARHETDSTQTLKKLYQILIQPIANTLPQKAEERVIIVPQGALFRLPFAALPDSNGKYLIEKHTISTTPSIEALDLLYKRKTRKQKTSESLIVGNATLPKTSFKSCNPTNLSPLPGAEQEAEHIAVILKTQALTRDKATETAVLARISKAGIIHLATSSCKNDDSSIISLATSNQDDGWLTAEEIQKLQIQADLVVLNSYDTALEKMTADGIVGLSRAFLTAGANSVITSLWDVDDATTASLMISFYENYSKSHRGAGALRQAMLKTMKKYPNPRYWAAFTLIGT